MCMKPWPILQQSSMDLSGVTPYDTHVRNHELDLAAIRTYSHTVEVLVNLLGNLIGELATGYRQAAPSPVQCMDLALRGQNIAAYPVRRTHLTPFAIIGVAGKLRMG